MVQRDVLLAQQLVHVLAGEQHGDVAADVEQPGGHRAQRREPQRGEQAEQQAGTGQEEQRPEEVVRVPGTRLRRLGERVRRLGLAVCHQ